MGKETAWMKRPRRKQHYWITYVLDGGGYADAHASFTMPIWRARPGLAEILRVKQMQLAEIGVPGAIVSMARLNTELVWE